MTTSSEMERDAVLQSSGSIESINVWHTKIIYLYKMAYFFTPQQNDQKEEQEGSHLCVVWSEVIRPRVDPHVCSEPGDLTSHSDRDALALRGKVLTDNEVVVNAAVVALVGVVCSRKQEADGVVESRLCLDEGLVEEEAEVASWILWLHRAVKGEDVAPEEPNQLLLLLVDGKDGMNGQIRMYENVCEQRRERKHQVRR